MMRNVRKKIILFGMFSFVLLVSLYYCSIKYTKMELKLVENDIIDNIELGDSHCIKTTTKCSYNCSGYQNKGSKPSNCRSSVPSNGGCAGSSFYVSCTATGGVYCSRTSQTTSCTECEEGYKLEKGTCVEETPTVENVTGGGYAYLAANETATFSFSASGKLSDSKNFNPQWNSSPGGFSGAGSSFSITVGGTGKGTGNGCKETKYTVTASQGGKSASKTATVCKYCTSWHGPIRGNFYFKSKQNTSKPSKGCFYFEGERQISGGYSYTGYYTRCCGSPPASNLGACYGDEKYLGIATKIEWLPAPSGDLKYKYSDIKDSNECVLMPNPQTCTATRLKPEPITKETEVCEEETVLDLVDKGQECGGNQFYQIKCTQRIITSFDMDDDELFQNNKKKLLIGQGFEYGIKISTIKTCEGNFNAEVWKDSYNKIIAKINTIPNNETDAHVLSRKRELQNIASDIIDIVNAYNSYDFISSDYDEKNNLSISYFENNVKKTDYFNFDSVLLNEGNGEYVSKQEVKLGIKGVNNPYNFVWNNNSDRRIVKLIPKKTYIDKYTGNITDANNENAIDGGNRIYTNTQVDPGIQQIIITVDNLGGKDSSIVNNKCSVEVVNPNLSYRPIDVSNPFINDRWERGNNWVNELYDFTRTIHASTWSEPTISTMNISADEIVEIKNETKVYIKNGVSPYLGVCGIVNNTSDDKVCKLVNSRN